MEFIQAALAAATEACREAIAAFPGDGSYDADAVSAYLEAARQQQLVQIKMRETNDR